jgi:uncharacterized protein
MKDPKGDTITIGIISDTHGHLAPEVSGIFKNVDLILHAGDIENRQTLTSLEAIAPVTAVRGNMDSDERGWSLCNTELVEIHNILLYMVHNLHDLDIDPESIGVAAVVFGHTHQAGIYEKGRVMFINPGSATLPRYGAAPSVALVLIRNQRLYPRIIHLNE